MASALLWVLGAVSYAVMQPPSNGDVVDRNRQGQSTGAESKPSPKYGWSKQLTTAVLTIAVALTLVGIKAFAYLESGSLSILSSLTDSVLDSFVSILVLGSIIYAHRPADEDHRWGHGKIEAVSALIQASVIIGGAAFLVFESIRTLVSPSPIVQHEVGITIMAISIVLSLAVVLWQRHALRSTDSLTIEAEAINYGTDALINAGTLTVLVASLYGAPVWIDPLFAILAACSMAWMARGLLNKALAMLLDRELPDHEREAIIEVISSHEAVLGWHDLRTRCHGQIYDISFDIEVDARLSLWDSHNVTKDLERALVERFPQCDVMIHVDPQGFTEDERHRVLGVHF